MAKFPNSTGEEIKTWKDTSVHLFSQDSSRSYGSYKVKKCRLFSTKKEELTASEFTRSTKDRFVQFLLIASKDNLYFPTTREWVKVQMWNHVAVMRVTEKPLVNEQGALIVCVEKGVYDGIPFSECGKV